MADKVYCFYEPETEKYTVQPVGCAYFDIFETADELKMNHNDLSDIFSRFGAIDIELFGTVSYYFKDMQDCQKCVDYLNNIL